MNGPDEIFIPDVILPFQFYDRERCTDATMPIRRLMLAVLTDVSIVSAVAPSTHEEGPGSRKPIEPPNG